jgi:hypothetical protein
MGGRHKPRRVDEPRPARPGRAGRRGPRDRGSGTGAEALTASPALREAAARQAAIRTIASGERPVYRCVAAQDGRWEVLGCPWLAIAADDRRSAVERAKTAVADWLGVDPGAFDVES